MDAIRNYRNDISVNGFDCECEQCRAALIPFALKYIRMYAETEEILAQMTLSQYRLMQRGYRVLNAFSRQLTSDSADGEVDVSATLKLVNKCHFCANMLKMWNDAAKKHHL